MAIFDTEAKDYDSWYDTNLGALVDKVETDLALSMFKPEKGMKILDVGCGTGNFSIKLAEMGCRVTGIDLSEEMLEEAKRKAKDKNLDIDFRIMNVYDLDFDKQEFDGIFTMAAFEFIEDVDKAYEQMYRVLKDDGKLLIGTINKDSNWGEMYLSDHFKDNTIFKHALLKTKDDFKNIRRNELVDIKECLFIPPNIEEDKVTIELEEELSKVENGGFICILWQKNN